MPFYDSQIFTSIKNIFVKFFLLSTLFLLQELKTDFFIFFGAGIEVPIIFNSYIINI